MSDRPRLSVVALVINDEGRVLMGRRRRGPAKGKFVMPGGGVEWGESIRRALEREVFEETRLRVVGDYEVGPLDVAELIGKKAHRVCLVYNAKPAAQQTKFIGDTDELTHVGYYSPNDPDVVRDMQDWTRASLTRLNVIEEPVKGDMNYSVGYQ